MPGQACLISNPDILCPPGAHNAHQWWAAACQNVQGGQCSPKGLSTLHIFCSSWGETQRPWSLLELQILSTADFWLPLARLNMGLHKNQQANKEATPPSWASVAS